MSPPCATHERSIDQLFAEHRQELFGFLTRQLASHDLAEDLCQEVYLRLRMTSNWPANPRAWLYRIARNLVIDHHRRQSRSPIFELSDGESEPVAASCLGPEDRLEHRQQLQVVNHALAELPSHVRQALAWYRLEGMTQREISERLSVSERMAGRYVQQAEQHCAARLSAASCYRDEVVECSADCRSRSRRRSDCKETPDA